MNNKKIINKIKKIDSLMKDPKNLDVYINFYEEILTDAYSIQYVQNINNLYSYFNQNTDEI